MRKLTLQEKIEIFNLGLGRSSRDTANLYNARNPLRQINQRTVSRLKKQLKLSGTLARKKRVHRQPLVTSIQFRETVQTYFNDNPNANMTKAATTLGKSRSTIHRTLKSMKFKAYKLRRHQRLFPDDYRHRLRFCTTMRRILTENPDWKNQIIWTDECLFKRNDSFNRQNNR